jgi:hypothetical protein
MHNRWIWVLVLVAGFFCGGCAGDTNEQSPDGDQGEYLDDADAGSLVDDDLLDEDPADIDPTDLDEDGGESEPDEDLELDGGDVGPDEYSDLDPGDSSDTDSDLPDEPDDVQCLGMVVPMYYGCPIVDSFAGCCDEQGRLIWCQDGDTYCWDCVGHDQPECGWDEGFGAYDCGAGGGDPSGEFPFACPDF